MKDTLVSTQLGLSPRFRCQAAESGMLQLFYRWRSFLRPDTKQMLGFADSNA